LISDHQFVSNILFPIFKLMFKFIHRPQNLDLTAVNEFVLMDNINIFQMNGFDFEFQQDGRLY